MLLIGCTSDSTRYEGILKSSVAYPSSGTYAPFASKNDGLLVVTSVDLAPFGIDRSQVTTNTREHGK